MLDVIVLFLNVRGVLGYEANAASFEREPELELRRADGGGLGDAEDYSHHLERAMDTPEGGGGGGGDNEHGYSAGVRYVLTAADPDTKRELQRLARAYRRDAALKDRRDAELAKRRAYEEQVERELREIDREADDKVGRARCCISVPSFGVRTLWGLPAGHGYHVAI